MAIAAAVIYWLIVGIWLVVLGVAIYYYRVNPIIFGASRILIVVVAIDTARDIVENVYFGVYFGAQYGLFNHAAATVLGQPLLLMMPKIMNVGAGCLVLFIMLLYWLPNAAQERNVLRHLATVDGLTGLNNRRHFLQLGDTECARSIRYHRTLSMLMLDIDHFKSVNDRYGHDVGDKVIVEVAQTCLKIARDADIVGRLGGEEFAILLPETDLDHASLFAERLRVAVAALTIPLDHEPLQVTISIGVSNRDDDISIAELMKRADLALYDAKRSGRNRHCTYQPV